MNTSAVLLVINDVLPQAWVGPAVQCTCLLVIIFENARDEGLARLGYILTHGYNPFVGLEEWYQLPRRLEVPNGDAVL